jgi:NADPH:quinone reductase and related Zn-dependent oxidoreductases
MKAAVLNAFGSPLAIETVPEPQLGTGEVIVDVAASRVLAYANEVLSGERKYLLELPVVPGPGAIGRIRATGPDATRLRPGDWVYCDPTVRSRDNALSPDIALQGLTGGSEGACACSAISTTAPGPNKCGCRRKTGFRSATSTRRTQADGARLARSSCPMAGSSPRTRKLERSRWSMAPPAVSAARPSPARWGWGHNAWSHRAERAGADRTDAAVRRPRPDRADARPRGRRSRAHPAGGPGPIDCVLDILRPRPMPCRCGPPMAVRPYGRVVLMGGIGMQGGAGLELPYPVDDAKLHHAPRAMDVPAACGHPDGRSDPLRPGRPRSFRGHRVRSRPRQRGGGACRRQRRSFQNDGDRAAALMRLRR